jgi:hypothetical protein
VMVRIIFLAIVADYLARVARRTAMRNNPETIRIAGLSVANHLRETRKLGKEGGAPTENRTSS